MLFLNGLGYLSKNIDGEKNFIFYGLQATQKRVQHSPFASFSCNRFAGNTDWKLRAMPPQLNRNVVSSGSLFISYMSLVGQQWSSRSRDAESV